LLGFLVAVLSRSLQFFQDHYAVEECSETLGQQTLLSWDSLEWQIAARYVTNVSVGRPKLLIPLL